MALVQQNEPQEPQSNGRRPPISSVEDDKIKKRQRRPSVRLNEIGDQPAAAVTKHWKPSFSNRPSKTRPLTNLPVQDNLAIATWKIKGGGSMLKREPKRPRTNWVSKDIHDGGPINEDAFSKDFEFEGSQSPLKDNPPLDDDVEDDDDDDGGNVRDLQFRARNDDGDGNVRDLQFRASHSVRARNDDDDGVDLDGPSDDSGRRFGKEDDGVRVWLDGLGLGRYWLLFKIHEVDEEVLPFLTLEDLKDMGINAVGSRRKMFCAIKKLSNDNNQGFS